MMTALLVTAAVFCGLVAYGVVMGLLLARAHRQCSYCSVHSDKGRACFRWDHDMGVFVAFVWPVGLPLYAVLMIARRQYLRSLRPRTAAGEGKR